MNKECTKCKETKSTDCFDVSNRNSIGFYSSCKDCRKLFREKNSKKIKDEKKKYYEKNKEKIKLKSRIWSKENKEKRNKTKITWRQKNPEKVKTYRQNRRSSLLFSDFSFSSEELLQRFEHQKRKCYWCMCDIKLDNFHVDHLIALSNGGSNHINNIVCSCPN